MEEQPSITLIQRLEAPKVRFFAALLSGVLTLASAVLMWTGAGAVAATAVAIAALAIGLYYGMGAAVESIREKKFDIDVLMVVGALAAAGLGEFRDGALLLFLFVLSGALEDLAEMRTNSAVTALSKLMPSRVFRFSGTGTPDADSRENWQEVPPEQLTEGDVLRVVNGESIAADGELLSEAAALDQASLTGESVLRDAVRGEALYSGTINAGTTLLLKVTHKPADSALQRVIFLVTQAQQQRQPAQQIIDKLSQPYSIGVMILSLIALGVFRFALDRPWYDSIFTAITLLIVASPCALIIATPTAALAAIARAARAGVLFKGGQAMTRLAAMRALAMDKTGTITEGRPRLIAVLPMDSGGGTLDPDGALAVAAALEQHSTHPVATAIMEAATKGSIVLAQVADTEVVTGKGVRGVLDGHPVRIGSAAFIAELINDAARTRVQAALAEAQQQGHIAVALATGRGAAVFILGDTERKGIAEAVVELRALGIRPIVMLTGDNQHTAAVIAKRAGIDAFKAELQPQDKVTHLQEMKASGVKVGLVGDGVNDAPALAAADVSLAIGSIGSQAAMESADIVLIRDQPALIPWAVRLARRADRTVKINIVFALSAILIMAITTVVGSWLKHPLPLWAGVLGHEGGTLLVVGHSLLLLSFRAVSAPLPAVTPPLPSR